MYSTPGGSRANTLRLLGIHANPVEACRVAEHDRHVSHLLQARAAFDNAQQMPPEILRLLSSADFDATSLLTMVLAAAGWVGNSCGTPPWFRSRRGPARG